jgi:hypothetical protein
MTNLEITSFAHIEKILADIIFPELEAGRPNWDKPHTQAVVAKVKEIIEHSPNLKLDKMVLVIAAYAHDWGYAGMFKDGQKLEYKDVMDAKEVHAILSAEKLTKLLKNPAFDILTKEQKDRAMYLVRTHDNLGQWEGIDALVLMEADTLGGLDVSYVTPTFDAASNEKYMQGVRARRLPYFTTDYGKSEFERLFRMRNEYFAATSA